MKMSILSTLAALLLQQAVAQVPPQTNAQGTLVVSSGIGGVSLSSEGSVTSFVVASLSGVRVAEKRLGRDRCTIWPGGNIACNPAPSLIGDTQSFSLAAGDYALSSSIQGCDGNCGNLDPLGAECRVPFSLRSGETRYIERVPSEKSCTLVFRTSPPITLSNTVAGRVLLPDGAPAANVRIGAIERKALVQPVIVVQSTETDNAGQYRFQGLPPGEYYFMAGKLNTPTYFPGVTAVADATAVNVQDRVVIDGVQVKGLIEGLNFSIAGPVPALAPGR